MDAVAAGLIYLPQMNYREPAMSSLDDDHLRWTVEMTPAQRFIAGAELFDYACTITLAGIRRQNPTLTEEQAIQVLRERLEWASRWDV